jgi:hypothetical protein
MPRDEIPSLAEWLAEYRSRPEPTEVVVATFDLVEPIPDTPEHGMAAGQVAVDVVRYDRTGWPGPPSNAHYVMGVDPGGNHTWDDWYESEQAAREAITDGHYGAVVERPTNAS